MLRGESLHEHPAADGHLLLIKRVEVMTPFLPDEHQAGILQLLQVMAHRRLVDLAIQPLDDVVDAQPGAALGAS
jgi:hypothetical protein